MAGPRGAQRGVWSSDEHLVWTEGPSSIETGVIKASKEHNLFSYVWLCWVFIALRVLLGAESGALHVAALLLGAWAPGMRASSTGSTWGSVTAAPRLSCSEAGGSSQTRDQTTVPCIRPTVNYWTTRNF